MPVTLNMIPATLQEFQTCPQMDLSKPENTCAMFLCALQLYIKDRDWRFVNAAWQVQVGIKALMLKCIAVHPFLPNIAHPKPWSNSWTNTETATMTRTMM